MGLYFVCSWYQLLLLTEVPYVEVRISYLTGNSERKRDTQHSPVFCSVPFQSKSLTLVDEIECVVDQCHSCYWVQKVTKSAVINQNLIGIAILINYLKLEYEGQLGPGPCCASSMDHILGPKR